jgi:hypothetical protein
MACFMRHGGSPAAGLPLGNALVVAIISNFAPLTLDALVRMEDVPERHYPIRFSLAKLGPLWRLACILDGSAVSWTDVVGCYE